MQLYSENQNYIEGKTYIFLPLTHYISIKVNPYKDKSNVPEGYYLYKVIQTKPNELIATYTNIEPVKVTATYDYYKQKPRCQQFGIPIKEKHKTPKQLPSIPITIEKHPKIYTKKPIVPIKIKPIQ